MEEEKDIVAEAMSAMAAEAVGGVRKGDPDAAPDLVASGLVKLYGDRTVVNGMDVSCRCGEVVGLLGPTGAGKTTTFYMVVGLVKPDGGKVVFRGEDITSLPVFQRAQQAVLVRVRMFQQFFVIINVQDAGHTALPLQGRLDFQMLRLVRQEQGGDGRFPFGLPPIQQFHL